MKEIYNVTEFAKLLNIKVKTLQKWDREGILKSYRTPTNRRYYKHEQYLEFMGESESFIESENKRYGIGYCRVSGNGQRSDLQNQIKFVEKFIENKELSINKIYTDIGSGLNYKRKNWNKIIRKCLEGKISFIVITYKDRFIRFGFDWFKEFLKDNYNVEIIVIKDETKSPQEELVQDLISIIHSFSCRIYGLRKYKTRINKAFERETEDYES